MGNNAVAIWLWNKVLGYLSWDQQKHCSTFVFDDENDIGQADVIIMEVVTALREWTAFASEAGVPERWIKSIAARLQEQCQK